MVDLRNRNLVDKLTSLSTSGTKAKATISCIRTYIVEQKFSDTIWKFPNVLVSQPFTSECNHQTQNFIETKRQLVYEKPRRLSPEKTSYSKIWVWNNDKNLLNFRPLNSILSDPNYPEANSKNRHNYSVWIIWVCQNALWTQKCCTIISTIH